MSKKKRDLNNVYAFFQPVGCPCMSKLMCMKVKWNILTKHMGFSSIFF